MSSTLNDLNPHIDLSLIKGFLADDEARALHQHALETAALGPCLEIGSYCGKSTVLLGSACQQHGNTLFAVDHHYGSEEHQVGEEYHDADLFDSAYEVMNSFSEFRKNMRTAQLEDTVVPIVAPSTVAAQHWNTSLSMVFIDGGHSLEAAMNDYTCWSRHIRSGGILAIHDLFPNPDEGGQAPITIYRLALASGQFDEIEIVNTLGILRRR
ncbi:MAG: class I SAM-dependent methyltransferase [Pseudomonadota bacterium]